MEVKRTVATYVNIIFPHLGGLHDCTNFQGVIWTHMKDSGLVETWTESGILGINAASQVMAGKSFACANRVHKLTLQALWQVLLPKLHSSLEVEDAELDEFLIATLDINDVVEIVSSDRFQRCMKSFVDFISKDNPTNQLWWQYMDMVSIILQYIHAQSDGIWDLHLYSFRKMLPYMFRYDHINYTRLGSVYLAEINNLPPEILEEFMRGDFVVKESDKKFNQVSPYHSLEWINAVGKKGGGIVVKTRSPIGAK